MVASGSRGPAPRHGPPKVCLHQTWPSTVDLLSLPAHSRPPRSPTLLIRNYPPKNVRLLLSPHTANGSLPPPAGPLPVHFPRPPRLRPPPRQAALPADPRPPPPP